MRASGGTTGRRPRVRSGTPIASVTSLTADTGGISGGGAGAELAGGDTGPRVSIGGPGRGGIICPDVGTAGREGGAAAGAGVAAGAGAGTVVGAGNGARSATAGDGAGEGGAADGAGSGEAAATVSLCRSPASRRSTLPGLPGMKSASTRKAMVAPPDPGANRQVRTASMRA